MKSVFQDLQTLLQEKRKNSHIAVNEKRKTEKIFFLFNRLFYEALENGD